MTNREKLHLAIATVGMKITLEEIIKMLDKHPEEPYLVTLKSDIKTALQHYEDRNKCKKCGQEDHGQTGEYPCPECGLPTVWDD